MCEEGDLFGAIAAPMDLARANLFGARKSDESVNGKKAPEMKRASSGAILCVVNHTTMM